MFDGEDELFKREVKRCSVYAEYGCGKSTSWVLSNTDAKVISVDTSLAWINQVTSTLTKSMRENLEIKHVDLGPLGNWGKPVSYTHMDRFSEYTDSIFQQDEAIPEVILIDGRFRVCCFLSSLLFAEPGTRLIFDDYIPRTPLHFVEKYTPRVEVCGRQCMFLVPKKEDIDFHELQKDINLFRCVMD